jgi:hypothetical protein
MLALAFLLTTCAVSGSGGSASQTSDVAPDGEAPPATEGSGVTAGDFLDLNGWIWFYTTAGEVRFAEITAMLDDLHEDGFRVLGIYSPYDGDPEKWLGCAPLDFYDVAPISGTLQDFRELVSAAHDRGMKVVTYFVNIYIDHGSDFFRTAERQYASGDRTSREVIAFRWSEDAQADLPTPAAGPSEWRYSDVAGAYYWSLWGEAGLDHTLPGAKAELARVEKFWLDIGVDGFMWDAAFVDPAFRELMVDLPVSYTANDKWLTFESTAAEASGPYYEFGLTSWFNLADDDTSNDYSRIAVGPSDADDLEAALAYSDAARSAGRLTHAWSPWGAPTYPNNERMLVQEAALLAGAGISYGVPSYTALRSWPETARVNWYRVLAMVNENPALLPSASRRRLPAGEDPKAYAMIRTSRDDSRTVLLVYNFRNQAATVAVDLGGTGIRMGQTPHDLFAGSTPPPITDRTYRLDLPAYGFAILQVATQ